MALTSSDVNKKVRYSEQRFGYKEGRLLGLTANHETAFVQWDSALPSQIKREPVPAHLLTVVEETGTEDAGGATL